MLVPELRAPNAEVLVGVRGHCQVSFCREVDPGDWETCVVEYDVTIETIGAASRATATSDALALSGPASTSSDTFSGVCRRT
jgi:hypothetical protein